MSNNYSSRRHHIFTAVKRKYLNYLVITNLIIIRKRQKWRHCCKKEISLQIATWILLPSYSSYDSWSREQIKSFISRQQICSTHVACKNWSKRLFCFEPFVLSKTFFSVECLLKWNIKPILQNFLRKYVATFFPAEFQLFLGLTRETRLYGIFAILLLKVTFINVLQRFLI